MNDRDFDQLLYQGAAQLPPEAVGQEPPAPWREALWRVCWGLGLTSITLNIALLQYILPALGSVLLYLGFRALRRESSWFQLGYVLSALLLLARGAVTVLNATPAAQWLATGEGELLGLSLALTAWLLYFALWRGLKGVFRKAGHPPKTAAAGGLVVWYSLLLPLSMAGAGGPLVWPVLLLWILLLRGLYRASRALDRAGYAISPAPAPFSEQRVILVWLGLLLAAVFSCLFLFRRFPVDASPAQAETGQTELRQELLEQGFPEDVLSDLTDGEVALLEGVRTVTVKSYGPHPKPDEEIEGLAMYFIQVELPQGRVRYFLWFSWDQAPDHRLREGLEIIPDYQNALTMDHSAPLLGRLLWEEDGQLWQAPLQGEYGTHTETSLFCGSSTYRSFPFHFSLPQQGEHLRGYVSYGMAATQAEVPTLFNAQARYVHQERWLSYPWETPLQHQWQSWNNTDSVFPARQFLTTFSLNHDALEA